MGPLPAPGPLHHDCPAWFLAYGNDDNVKGAFDRFWSDDGGGTKTAQLAMWDQMASRHAQRAGVIGFQLFNEPSVTSADARPGSTVLRCYGDRRRARAGDGAGGLRRRRPPPASRR